MFFKVQYVVQYLSSFCVRVFIVFWNDFLMLFAYAMSRGHFTYMVYPCRLQLLKYSQKCNTEQNLQKTEVWLNAACFQHRKDVTLLEM